ncbi:MAG: anaerobic ribonucleoside-triphosphate reductase activating protein [Sphingomonadaceae bacterium]|nr:anaerobic ribonucleoside-triphosphate reductase activating protein [Sphingomonadaceae bacterium]
MATIADNERRERRRARRATPFHAITPFTLLDFPGRSACILWVAGCNMRCGYCHNPDIVLGKGTLREHDALAFLRRRQGLLDGVVLSGGEATTWPDLGDFAGQVKAMGFAVKLDTNGLRPDVVAQMLDRRLIDHVALDYKAPPERFRAVTGTVAFPRFARTLDLLCGQDRVTYEVRTTVHDALLDEGDILAIATDLARRGYRGRLAVQQAVVENDRPLLGSLPPQSRRLDRQWLAAQTNLGLEFR